MTEYAEGISYDPLPGEFEHNVESAATKQLEDAMKRQKEASGPIPYFIETVSVAFAKLALKAAKKHNQ